MTTNEANYCIYFHSSLYSKSPTYKWVPFQDHIRKCNKVSLGTQIIQWAIHHCFYTCFQTCWAWNKDLYSVQHSTVMYTKAQAPVEDACMWLYTRHMWTHVTGRGQAHSHLSQLATWRLVCRELTVWTQKQPKLSLFLPPVWAAGAFSEWTQPVWHKHRGSLWDGDTGKLPALQASNPKELSITKCNTADPYTNTGHTQTHCTFQTSIWFKETTKENKNRKLRPWFQDPSGNELQTSRDWYYKEQKPKGILHSFQSPKPFTWYQFPIPLSPWQELDLTK